MKIGHRSVFAVTALVFSASCDLISDPICTQAGCSDAIRVVIAGSPNDEFDVEVSATSAETRAASCRIFPDRSSCYVYFDGFAPEEVTLKVIGPRHQTSITLQPAYDTVRPSGPRCPPTCIQANITVNDLTTSSAFLTSASSCRHGA